MQSDSRSIQTRRLSFWPGPLLRAALVAALLPLSCAVPVPPTGGPADEDPPGLAASTPSDGSVQFQGRTLAFEFDEYVDRISFQRAFSINPDVSGSPEFDWSGRSVKVQLPEDLRPSTTYIVTLDDQMRDARNVTLTTPISLAFSTGETIDQGGISGRVREPMRGDPARSIDVYAWASADSAALSSPPLYRTQTATDGAFTFSYLAPGSYFVVGVRDGNRNRKIDPAEPLAVPPLASIRVDTATVVVDRPWILAVHDSTPPRLDGVRAVTSRDVELRFSESVFASSVGAAGSVGSLSLADSASGRPVTIHSVYVLPDAPRTLVLDVDPLASGVLQLQGAPQAADSSGNPVPAIDQIFRTPESLQERVPAFDAFLPDSSAAIPGSMTRLWLGRQAGFRSTRPLDPEAVLGHISAQDTLGTEIQLDVVPVNAIRFDLTPHIDPNRAFEPGRPFEIRLDSHLFPGDSARVHRYVIAGSDQTGEISGIIAPGSDSLRVEIFPMEGTGAVLSVPAPDGRFLATGLPGGFRYRIRAWKDTDGNGVWSSGSLLPYRAAEPILWFDGTEAVRARWESAIADTLRFSDVGSDAPVPSPEKSAGTSPDIDQ